MVSNKILAAFACLVFVASGCATGSGSGMDKAKCAMIGGVLGAGAGVVGSGANHDNDETRHAVGGAIGALVGAGLGSMLCADSQAATEKRPPTVRASANPSSGPAPLTTELRAVGKDDGSVVSYEWDLGDGTNAKGARVSHTYQEPGDYTARVTVKDNDGMIASTVVPVRAERKASAPSAKRIVLRGVNFAFDRADIRPDAQVILDAAAEVLSENPGVRVQIAGHTDSVGTEAYNQGLSERRAKSVQRYLVGKGISSGRLSSVGSGEANPVASNSTDDGRAQNRRVELNIQ
ncbi:MAG: OmpA family protein [bacterium]|nr:OmpA family protein [bacterium]